MRNFFALTLLVLLSCSPNTLRWDSMEQMYVELHRPEYYHWFSGSVPEDSYQEFLCNEGPYTVRVSNKIIEVETGKPIKKAEHLRGKYGSDAVELELKTASSFEVKINEPDPYAEVFRIYY